MEDKILGLQFEPVSIYPTCPRYSDGSDQNELEVQHNRVSSQQWYNCQNCEKMSTRLYCVCCYEIREIKPFHLNDTPRLSWNAAAVEFTEAVICRCFSKQVFLNICNIYRKTPVLQSLFKGCIFIKKRLQDKCFPMSIAKFLKTAFLQNTSNFLQNLLKITGKKIIFQERFSQKFLKNHFLVLTSMFLKISPLKDFAFFCLSLNMLEAYLELSQTSRWSLFRKQ